MKQTTMVLTFLLSAVCFAAAQTNSVEAEILKLDRELFEAVWRADATARDRIVANDFAYVTYAGEFLTKPEWIATVKTPASPSDEFKISDAKVRVYGDTAIATGYLETLFRLEQSTGRAEFRYTNVYMKRQGRWLAVSGQATPVNKYLWKRNIVK